MRRPGKTWRARSKRGGLSRFRSGFPSKPATKAGAESRRARFGKAESRRAAHHLRRPQAERLLPPGSRQPRGFHSEGSEIEGRLTSLKSRSATAKTSYPEKAEDREPKAARTGEAGGRKLPFQKNGEPQATRTGGVENRAASPLKATRPRPRASKVTRPKPSNPALHTCSADPDLASTAAFAERPCRDPAVRRLAAYRPEPRPAASAASAAATVCAIVTLVVTVPNPPGTGVSAATTGSTASKSTSPHRLPCASKLMPTSSTVCPGAKHSAPNARARPVAQTTTSADRQMPARFSVRLWQTVTLALRRTAS